MRKVPVFFLICWLLSLAVGLALIVPAFWGGATTEFSGDPDRLSVLDERDSQ